MHAAFQVDRSEDSYTAAIAGKTAALMATSCRIGALTGGLPRDEVDAFTEFGRYFGMVFQIRDDILDVVGTEAELGKPAGQDLAEGIYTLPVLLALADPGRRSRAQPAAGPAARPARTGQGPLDRGRVGGHRPARCVVARRYAELAASAATVGDRRPIWLLASPTWPTPWSTTSAGLLTRGQSSATRVARGRPSSPVASDGNQGG